MDGGFVVGGEDDGGAGFGEGLGGGEAHAGAGAGDEGDLAGEVVGGVHAWRGPSVGQTVRRVLMARRSSIAR